jgi:hypothetical protein
MLTTNEPFSSSNRVRRDTAERLLMVQATVCAIVPFACGCGFDDFRTADSNLTVCASDDGLGR